MPKRLLTVPAVAVFLVILLAGPSTAQVRGIMITPLAGYQWGGTIELWQGEAKITDAGNWGIAIDIPVSQSTAFVEFIFTRQDAELDYREYGTGEPSRKAFDLGVEYYELGGLYTMDKQGLKPFGTMSIGATRFDPDSSLYGSQWKFSAALGIGLLIPATERIGIRVHTRLLLPFLYSGGGLWCGTGGCSIGVSGSSAVVQGDVAVGLVIRI